VNEQALGHTKKLVSEKMNDKGEDWKEELVRMFSPAIEKVMTNMFNGGNQANGNGNGQGAQQQPPQQPQQQQPVDINPEYTQNVVDSLAPHLEDLLSSNEQRAATLIENIKAQKEYLVVTSSSAQVDLFYETLSLKIGVPKAKRVMTQFGFEDEEEEKGAEFKDVNTDKTAVG